MQTQSILPGTKVRYKKPGERKTKKGDVLDLKPENAQQRGKVPVRFGRDITWLNPEVLTVDEPLFQVGDRLQLIGSDRSGTLIALEGNQGKIHWDEPMGFDSPGDMHTISEEYFRKLPPRPITWSAGDPPNPANYSDNAAFEADWIEWEKKQAAIGQQGRWEQNKEQCESSLDVRASGQGLSLAASVSDLNSSNSSNETSTVSQSLSSDILAPPSGETSEPLLESRDSATLLPSQTLASLSASKESGSAQLTSETVSPMLSESLEIQNPTSSSSRTSLDSLAAPERPETNPVHISNGSSGSFTSAGTMRNGFVSPQPVLAVPGLESGSLWLESPGALGSSGSGRPPGQTILEVQLKQEGAMQSGEVANPEFLESAFNLELGYTNPQDKRSASEFLAGMELSASAALPSETRLTQRSPELALNASSTSTVLLSDETPNSSEPKGRAISFGWTSQQLLAGRKTCTRRTWKDSYAQYFIDAFNEGRTTFPALDKEYRYGGKLIGEVRLTCCPYKEALSDMPESDLEAEGGMCATVEEFINEYFEGDKTLSVWVVRFEFSHLAPTSSLSIPCWVKQPQKPDQQGIIIGDKGSDFTVFIGATGETKSVPKLWVFPNFSTEDPDATFKPSDRVRRKGRPEDTGVVRRLDESGSSYWVDSDETLEEELVKAADLELLPKEAFCNDDFQWLVNCSWGDINARNALDRASAKTLQVALSYALEHQAGKGRIAGLTSRLKKLQKLHQLPESAVRPFKRGDRVRYLDGEEWKEGIVDGIASAFAHLDFGVPARERVAIARLEFVEEGTDDNDRAGVETVAARQDSEVLSNDRPVELAAEGDSTRTGDTGALEPSEVERSSQSVANQVEVLSTEAQQATSSENKTLLLSTQHSALSTQDEETSPQEDPKGEIVPNPKGNLLGLSLDELASELRNRYAAYEAAEAEANSKISEALVAAKAHGEALLIAKAKVKAHSNARWLPWLEANNPGCSERTAQRNMRIAENWEELEKATRVADFPIGIKAAEKLLASRRGGAVEDPNNWGTPNTSEQPVVGLVVQALGGQIDLDPTADSDCAERSAGGNRSIPASRHFTKEDNCLVQEWHGRVFMNPPFDEPGIFLNKLVEEFEAGRVTEAIALLKSGCLHNKGAGTLIEQHAAAACAWRGRIAFLGSDGNPVKGADFDCVFVYFGTNRARFHKVFAPWGTVILLTERDTIDAEIIESGGREEFREGGGERSTFTSAPLSPHPASSVATELADSQKQLLGTSWNGQQVLPETDHTDQTPDPIHLPSPYESACKDLAVGVSANREYFSADQLLFMWQAISEQISPAAMKDEELCTFINSLNNLKEQAEQALHQGGNDRG